MSKKMLKVGIIGISLLFASGTFGADSNKVYGKEASVKIDTIGCNNPLITIQLFKYVIWDNDKEAFIKAATALFFSKKCVAIEKKDKLFILQDLEIEKKGLIQVRRKGEVEAVWIFKVFLKDGE